MQPTSSAQSGAPDAADTLVKHFSAEVREAFGRFRTDRSSADADIVVLAVVRDHQPKSQHRETTELTDSSRLVEDLGFDSIAITEMVFFLEDLFHVRIGNDEILRVRTVGDLRSFVREKLAATPAQRA
ncbi:MAG TPA: acyl carrier protein [Opitutus sp.]|nr:acyl carrier protein [Opitutus sp.]